MTRIVKFKGRNGDTIGVNPDHVAYIATPMQERTPLLGHSAIQLAQPTVVEGQFKTTIIVVAGSVDETIDRLNHGETAN